MGTLAVIRESYCRRCPAKCGPFLGGTIDLHDPANRCPIGRWQAAGNNHSALPKPVLRLGDIVEKLAKPIARALRLNCLQKDGTLKPLSPCAQRRDRLNRVFERKPPGPQPPLEK